MGCSVPSPHIRLSPCFVMPHCITPSLCQARHPPFPCPAHIGTQAFTKKRMTIREYSLGAFKLNAFKYLLTTAHLMRPISNRRRKWRTPNLRRTSSDAPPTYGAPQEAHLQPTAHLKRRTTDRRCTSSGATPDR